MEIDLVQYRLLTVLVAVAANALVRVVVLSVIAVFASFVPLGGVSAIGSSFLGAVGATAVYGVKSG
ncbi:hypothetical protein [Natrialba asiatica]|uniref:Uncharacterized protein n=1 Tax=Natrialba asiatica (strain ATCC 700177 / DSM 12278 / JCM 9576 / FERM P-10747 / NBRC 102637 / 172P1) TaxID=29540 RepID=M0AKK7_NATA1|nr:hypothetical protein [Natrialba asiatica]ELY99250.1 hypothetical protein C481_15405 [Natrialba asiatica DSM 12278]